MTTTIDTLTPPPPAPIDESAEPVTPSVPPTHELRYRGVLLAHLTEEEAHAHVERRFAHPVEREALVRSDWTITARRPVELFMRGSLLETYTSRPEAEHARSELIAEQIEERRARGLRPLPEGELEDVLRIVDREHPEEEPAPPGGSGLVMG